MTLKTYDYWFVHLRRALLKVERPEIIMLLNWSDMEDDGEQPGRHRRTRAANQTAVGTSFNQSVRNGERIFNNSGRDRGDVGYTYDIPEYLTRNSDVNSNGYRRSEVNQRNCVAQRNTDICHYNRTENRNDPNYVPEINSCVNKSQTTKVGERLDTHDRTASLVSRRANNSGEFQYQENRNDLSCTGLPNIQVSNTAVSNNQPNSLNVAPERPPSPADDITDSNCYVDNNVVTTRNDSRTDVEIQQQNLDSYSKQNKIQKLIQNSSVELRNTNQHSSQNSDNESVERSTDLSRDNMNLDKSGYVKELVKSALKNPELIHNSKGERQQEDNGFQTKGNCSVVNPEDQKKNINSDRSIKQITKELKQQHDAYQEKEEKPFLSPDSEITDPIRENQTNQSQLNFYEDNFGDIRENLTSLTTTTNTGCSQPKENLQRRGIPEIPNNPSNTSNMGMNGNGGHFTSFGGSTSNALNTSSTIDLQNEPSREVAVFPSNQDNHIDVTNRGVHNVAQPSSTAHSINMCSGANTSSCASTIDLLNGPRSEIVVAQIQNNTPTTELGIPPGNEVGVSQTTANNNEVSFNTKIANNGGIYDNAMPSTLGSPNSFSSNLVNTSYSSRESVSTISTVDPTGLSEGGRIRNEFRISDMPDDGNDESPTFSCIVDEQDFTATDFSRNNGVLNYQTFSNDLNLSGPSTTSTVDPMGLSERGIIRNEVRISGMADDGHNRIRENRETTSRSVLSNDIQGFNQEDEGINEHFSTQEDQPLTVPEAGWLSSMNAFPSLSEIMSYALDR
ncbi:probable serine/threonine-protein kinase clkA isoform X2 [Patella vulgata]|nr:probable serine/threonine-protein kinase clkA isoform X2 [Patella vulgata]